MVRLQNRSFWLLIWVALAALVYTEPIGAQSQHGHSMSTGDDKEKAPPTKVSVNFFAEPEKDSVIKAGGNIKLGFRITDSQSGQEVSGLRPVAWAQRRRTQELAPDQKACEQLIRTFQRTGILTVPADVDLNGFSILTVNDDNSVGIYNPKVNLKTANLHAIIHFNGRPAQWTLDHNHGLVYITLPQENKVAVIDVIRRALLDYIDVGKKPRQILTRHAGRYLWVGNDKDGTVSVIDRSTRKVVNTLTVGEGPIEIELDPSGHYAFVGTAGEGRVSVIDIQQMKEVGRVALGTGQLSLSYSLHRNALFVAHENRGQIALIDPGGKQAIGLNLEPGIQSITSTPDGRFVLALIPEKRKVMIIDTAGNRVIGELPTETDPDHIVFSPDYAYIRNRSTPNVTVIELSKLDNPSEVPVVSVPIGTVPPASVKGLPGVATMAAMHHGGHALILNPADLRVYMYMEGMMAPMDSFKTYTSRPLGIMLHHRSLEERESAGTYQAIVKIEKPGIYDIPFYLSDPIQATCFELVVNAGAEGEKSEQVNPVFSSLFTGTRFRPKEPSRLRFKLLDDSSDNPIPELNDVLVMAFLKGTHWQHRTPAHHIGGGIYETEFTFPRTGQYYVLVDVQSLGISFGHIRHAVANVVAEK